MRSQPKSKPHPVHAHVRECHVLHLLPFFPAFLIYFRLLIRLVHFHSFMRVFETRTSFPSLLLWHVDHSSLYVSRVVILCLVFAILLTAHSPIDKDKALLANIFNNLEKFHQFSPEKKKGVAARFPEGFNQTIGWQALGQNPSHDQLRISHLETFDIIKGHSIFPASGVEGESFRSFFPFSCLSIYPISICLSA